MINGRELLGRWTPLVTGKYYGVEDDCLRDPGVSYEL